MWWARAVSLPSSSMGIRAPRWGSLSNSPASIASRIWRSMRLSQSGPDCSPPAPSRRMGLIGTGSQDAAGVEDAQRIERRLDGAHRRDGALAALDRQPLPPGGADPVL